ncbi:MAG: hypothetical protein RLZZ426_1174 [Actinomycetota bacterium]|jgi:hypothetical protein
MTTEKNNSAPIDEPIEESTPIGDAIAAEKLLSQSLGGVQGVIDSAVPSIVYLLTWSLTDHNLQTAVFAALGVAVALAIVRILQKKSLQQVLSGMFGMALAAFVTTKTGKAEDFYLPGILINGAYAIAVGFSIAIKRPVFGYVIGALTQDLTGWRSDPQKYRLYRLITWWWVGSYSLRLIVLLPLYFAGNVEALGTAKLITGWPLNIAVMWVSYRAVKNQSATTSAR